MENDVNWEEVLKDRYATFKLEEEGFLESLKVCNSTEVSAEKIYHTIKQCAEIPKNLKIMYKRAVFGMNKKVRLCIKNCIGNLRRNLR